MLEENKLGQRFRIDLECGLDLARAGKTDLVEATVSYADIYTLVKEATEDTRYKLIEALAQHIVDRLFAHLRHPLSGSASASASPKRRSRRLRANSPSNCSGRGPRTTSGDGVSRLGANLGDPAAQIEAAIARLAEHPDIAVIAAVQADRFHGLGQDRSAGLSPIRRGRNRNQSRARDAARCLSRGRKRDGTGATRSLGTAPHRHRHHCL